MTAGSDPAAPRRGDPPDLTRQCPPGIPLPADADLRKRYGITLAGYLRLLEAQGWVCRLCGKPPATRPLVVDHDHDPPYPIDGLIHVGENRYARQDLRRYFKSRPPVELFVPAGREQAAIRKREREKQAARDRRKARPATPTGQPAGGYAGKVAAALAATSERT